MSISARKINIAGSDNVPTYQCAHNFSKEILINTCFIRVGTSAGMLYLYLQNNQYSGAQDALVYSFGCTGNAQLNRLTSTNTNINPSIFYNENYDFIDKGTYYIRVPLSPPQGDKIYFSCTVHATSAVYVDSEIGQITFQNL